MKAHHRFPPISGKGAQRRLIAGYAAGFDWSAIIMSRPLRELAAALCRTPMNEFSASIW